MEGNQLVSNFITGNPIGIVAGFVAPYPPNNLYQGSQLMKNGLDVLDLDTDCNDAWISNNDSQYAIGGGFV